VASQTRAQVINIQRPLQHVGCAEAVRLHLASVAPAFDGDDPALAVDPSQQEGDVTRIIGREVGTITEGPALMNGI
jgi:hypothetical protein